jgi:hypothetical protein
MAHTHEHESATVEYCDCGARLYPGIGCDSCDGYGEEEEEFFENRVVYRELMRRWRR